MRPILSPRSMRVEKSPDDRLAGEALGDVVQLDDHLAGALARADGEAHLPYAIAARRALAAQLLEPLHAAFIARAPRFDAFAYPRFFLREQLVEARVRARLGLEELVLAPLIGRVRAGKTGESAAVELDDARRNRIQKTPVMRDEQHAPE